ncbi:MAG: 5-formyltetrahydrofolate cyclo-ligase [Sphingobacteriaceae bacterium]
MDKKELRRFYKSTRGALPAAEIKARDAMIFQQLCGFDWSEIRYLHCYLPIVGMNEYDTGPFIEWIWTHYPEIQVVASKSDFKAHEMTHYPFNQDTPLLENAWGIPEPVVDDPVEIGLLDGVLVPLLVADVEGNRVGYGKGFYDRFLARCKPGVLKMGISYFPPIERIENVGAWDIPIDGLFFPQATRFFAEGRP